jgi:FkbM family methyltransferase
LRQSNWMGRGFRLRSHLMSIEAAQIVLQCLFLCSIAGQLMLTIKSVALILRPPYIFQPQQIVKRIWREMFWKSRQAVIVNLPWGIPITVDPREAIGYNIWSRGLYEVGVTETLWRLTGEGETAVDAGANVGYMTSILGVRVGNKGKVICFEPNPMVYGSLSGNVDCWKTTKKCGSFLLHQVALGSENKGVVLQTSEYIKTNRGTAWVSEVSMQTKEKASGSGTPVEMFRLDDLLSQNEAISVLKIDVEGSELSVLQGMKKMLENHSVRDIVFEESDHFPGPTHKFLQSLGYSIFGLEEGFWRVKCLAESEPQGDPTYNPIRNYLATADPERAKRLLGTPGWQSFGLLRQPLKLLLTRDTASRYQANR